MEVRGFLGDHPYLSGGAVLAVAAVILFVAAPGFLQGTFVDDQGCPWRPVNNPKTGGNFTSESDYREYVQDQGQTLPDDVRLQVRDGVLYQNAGGCGGVGGGTQ